jgi:hypothetical protein
MKHSLIRILALALPLLCASTVPLLADSLVLDGQQLIFGTYTGGGPDEFRMGTGEKGQVYAREKVIALVIGTGKLRAGAQLMIGETDQLELQDGTMLEGRYAGGDTTAMRFEIDGEIKSIPLSTIKRLTPGHPDPATKNPEADQP